LIEWIKTEEKLPPGEEDVLIFDTSDNLCYIAYLTTNDKDVVIDRSLSNKKDKLMWVESAASSPCSWKLEDIKHWAVLTPPED
jgi:hypothetical protein